MKNLEMCIHQNLNYSSLDYLEYFGNKLETKNKLADCLDGNNTGSIEDKQKAIYNRFILFEQSVNSDVTLTKRQKQNKIERLSSISTVQMLAVKYGKNSKEVQKFMKEAGLCNSDVGLYSESLIDKRAGVDYVASDNKSESDIELMEYENIFEKINEKILIESEYFQTQLYKYTQALEDYKAKPNGRKKKTLDGYKNNLKMIFNKNGIAII